MQKTTVYLDEATYKRLKQIARRQGRAPAEMVREAVDEYTARHAPKKRPRSIGAFKSDRKDLGQSAESLLSGLGEGR